MAFTKISEEVISIQIEGAEGVSSAYLNIAELQDAFEANTKKADSAAKNAGKSTKTLGDSLKGLKGNLMAAGGAAQVFETGMRAAAKAMSAIKAPIDLAVSFDREFSLVRTLSKDVGEDMKNDLLQLAKTLPQTAGELTRGVYTAISFGVDPSQAVDFVKAAANVATGTGAELQKTVEVLTGATQAFTKEGMTASRAADLMQATIKGAAINGEELNAVFGQMAASAQLGVELPEMLSAVGALSKIGIKPAQGVVQVNAAIKALQGTTAEGAKALRALNVEFGVEAFQKKGLTGVLRDVMEATGGSASELRKLTDRNEAFAGLLGLMKNDMSAYNDLLNQNANSAGASAAAAREVHNSTAGMMDRMRSLKDGILRDLGQAFINALEDPLRRITEYMRTNGDQFVRVLGDAAKAFVSFGEFIVSNGSTIITMLTGIFGGRMVADFGRSLAGLGPIIAGTADDLTSLGGRISRVLSSAGVIGAAIAGASLLGTAIGEAIGDSMAKEVTARGQVALGELQKRQAQLLHELTGKGFKGLDDFSKQTEGTTGGKLGFGLANVSASDIGTVEEVYGRILEKAQGKTKEDREMVALAQVQATVAEDLERRSEKYRENYEQIKNLSDEIAALGFVETKTQEQLEALGRAGLKAKHEENKAQKANLELMNERLRKGSQIISQDMARLGRKTLAAPSGPPPRKPSPAAGAGPSGPSDEEKARIAANQSIEQGITAAKIAGIQDRDEKEFRLLEEKQTQEFTKAQEHNANLERLQVKHDLEMTNLFETQAEREVSAEEKKAERLAQAMDAMRDRRAQMGAQDIEAKMMSLEREDEEFASRLEIEGVREDEITQLRAEMAQKRIRIKEQETRAVIAFENQMYAASAQSLSQTFGAMKTIAETVGASSATMGLLESLMIASRAVYHGFMAGSEMANAASAAAAAVANPAMAAKATAHKFAAGMHIAQAAAGAVQAGAALVGGGGGAGGFGGGGPVSMPTPANTGFNRQELTEQRSQASIQFGDIVLSDVPALLSRDGSRALGAQVAESVARELGRRANIQGGARIPRRAMRRS